MNNTAIEKFKRWYSAGGHWIYDTRADALSTWIERGIKTLPSAPANATGLLAAWVADDAMPALTQKLRAKDADATRNALTLQACKAAPRRFTGESITGFGCLS